MDIIMKHISKTFGQNQVLVDVNMHIKPGEVHALIGENGAGKSTLMNILTGLLRKNGGSILVSGKETSFRNPLAAEHRGISFIHQELNNFPDMTVVENMFLKREVKNSFGLLNQSRMKELAAQYLGQLHIKLNVDTRIGRLSVGQQQMVEIAKSLMTNAEVIIMDEPTAALTEKEINQLFNVIKTLKTRGVSFIYISHRMEEIFKISDTVTVMRDGVTVHTYRTANVDVQRIVKDMVGREMHDFYPKRHPKFGDVIFKAEHLTKKGVFKDISFAVHAGEIFAFSGLMGSGRTEIMKGIFGIDKLASGKIYVNGEEVHHKAPYMAIKNKVGFLTEDRKTEGLVLIDSIADNISLPSIRGFKKHGFIDDHAIEKFVHLLMNRLKIKAQNAQEKVINLSGGNQQKVVLAKWIGSGSQILILDEPTRGVDVGAKREIYNLMNELTDRGVAIIMVSSDLPEILGISDRIAAIYEGRLMGIIPTAAATQEQVMALDTGGVSQLE